jgi:HAD superfamily hydrolase (TIGR01484 family)
VIMSNKKVLQWVDNILVENSEGNFIWKEPQSEEEATALFSHFHIEKTTNYRFINKDLSNIKADINSILIDMKSEKYINDLVTEIKSLTNTLIVRNWSVPNLGTIIEINSIFSSKGTALKYLSSYYGIPIENCIAFGDQDNDANMLTKANYSYAMKNGSTTAKLSAKYMTKKTNNDDGVVFELTKYIK